MFAAEVHGQESLDAEEDVTSVVFIQGLNTSSFAWHPQAEYFGNLPGYRCLFFDNRAVGLSDSPLCRFSTQDMAWDVQELLEYLGWTDERSVHIVGVSMGGMIAQELVSWLGFLSHVIIYAQSECRLSSRLPPSPL